MGLVELYAVKVTVCNRIELGVLGRVEIRDISLSKDTKPRLYLAEVISYFQDCVGKIVNFLKVYNHGCKANVLRKFELKGG